jgi:hypothetical protein
MTLGDGLFYRYVASHMDAGPGDLNPVVAARGPSLRYGRIGLPAAIWLVSVGHVRLMPYAQPALMVLCAGAISAAAATLLPAAGLRAGLLPFLAIGLTHALSGGFSEPFAAAFGLWGIVLAARGRAGWASTALAVSLLTRETAVVFLLGAALACAIRRDGRAAGAVALAALPAAVWYLVVAARFGHLPLTDPYLSEAGTSAVPFASLAHALLHFSLKVRVIALAHIGLCLAGLRLWRRTAIGSAAAASVVQLAWFPLLSWHFLGDAFRTLAFLELLVLLAFAVQVSGRESAPAGALR